MIGVRRAWFVPFVFLLSAAPVAAEPRTEATEPVPAVDFRRAPAPVSAVELPVAPLADSGRRDSLWNGILIGTAVGVGSVVALDALLCDIPDGRCDTPWLAYLTLGGVGAAAGAGIDFVIGRNKNDPPTTVRLAPVVNRNVQGIRASIRF